MASQNPKPTVSTIDSPDPTTTSPNTQAEDEASDYEDEYPTYVSLLQDLPVTAPYELGDYELRHMPSGNQDSGWKNCLSSVENHDRELCQAYREQIDTLLVFAGLFSAVVTAFAVESYQWLQDDPTDTSLELLRDIAGLLAQGQNRTAPHTARPAQRLSGPAIVRINSFWFLSLSLSLSAALVGILCKQWLREFERNVGQSPETALGVRYVRFQGLEYWKVGSIVSSVPIIMQIALAFFIVGVIELLWRLNTIVACCVTVTAALTLAFYLATTLLPVAQYAYICMRCYAKPLRTRYYPTRQAFTEAQCAFKSAQAWLAFRVAQPVINHLLRAHGYQFSSHYPQAFVDHILRRTESWVAFDLNWLKCRENIHLGPRCAFESLTWIAMNLGEIHTSSSIWHCVWARLLKSRDSPEDLTMTTTEIHSVARSYPRIVALSNSVAPLARSQALIFQCSLRTDLPIDTAIELLLRVTDVLGACSRWTREALHATRVVYRNQPARLSDDVAIALFRLAESQTHDIVFKPDGPDLTTRYNGALAFRSIACILHRGTHLRDSFMPAMSGLILQWLRSRPSRLIVDVAIAVFEDMLWYLVSQGYRGDALKGLRQYRGIMFHAKLARAVAELWPDFSRRVYVHSPEASAVFWELLAIHADGFPELSRNRSAAPMDEHLEPAGNADGVFSRPPEHDGHTGEGTRTEPSDPVAGEREAYQPSPQGQLCIKVHGHMELDTTTMETDANIASSPADSHLGPESPLGSPVALDSSDPAIPPNLPETSSGLQHHDPQESLHSPV